MPAPRPSTDASERPVVHPTRDGGDQVIGDCGLMSGGIMFAWTGGNYDRA
jgi:hypothetical protein